MTSQAWPRALRGPVLFKGQRAPPPQPIGDTAHASALLVFSPEMFPQTRREWRIGRGFCNYILCGLRKKLWELLCETRRLPAGQGSSDGVLMWEHSRSPPSEASGTWRGVKREGEAFVQGQGSCVTLESGFPLSPLMVWGLQLSMRVPLLGREVCKQ